MEIIIRRKKKDRWSTKFDCCQFCGTNKKKHQSHGLCSACYNKAYRDAVKKTKSVKERPNSILIND